MNIKEDIREQELIQKMKQLIETIPSFKNIVLTTENLPIGDIIISNGTEERLIIERKSVNDLIASIKDGRYEEQSYRLSGLNHPNHNIIYLIEGDVNRVNRFRENQHIEKLTLYSAIFSLNYTKGFSVIRTFSIDETAIFLCNTTNKLTKSELENKKAYYSNFKQIRQIIPDADTIDTCKKEENQDANQNDNQDDKEIESMIPNEKEKESSDKDYINVVKRVKKENITTDNIDEIILCQIPGISSVTAIAVINKFKHIQGLIKAVENDITCLNDISYTNAKNQTRKINKTCIENIKQYLLKM